MQSWLSMVYATMRNDYNKVWIVGSFANTEYTKDMEIANSV